MLHSELGNTERKDLFHILDQNIDFSNKIQVYYALLNFKSDVFCRNVKAPSLLLECWVWGSPYCTPNSSAHTISYVVVQAVGSPSFPHPGFLSAHHLFCCSAVCGVSLLYPGFLSVHHRFRCSAGCGFSLLHPGFHR